MPAFGTDYTTPAQKTEQLNKNATSNIKYKLSMKNRSLDIRSYAGIQYGSNDTGKISRSLEVSEKINAENVNDGRSVKITKITQSKTYPTSHLVTMQVCAGKGNLYNPEVYVKSDIKSSNMKIWGLVKPNVCITKDLSMLANDQKTISVTFSKR
jgi:hypothetical protein